MTAIPSAIYAADERGDRTAVVDGHTWYHDHIRCVWVRDDHYDAQSLESAIRRATAEDTPHA